MTPEKAQELGLKECIFGGYETKILKVNGKQVTWYDNKKDQVIEGKIVEVEDDCIHLTDGHGYQVAIGIHL